MTSAAPRRRALAGSGAVCLPQWQRVSDLAVEEMYCLFQAVCTRSRDRVSDLRLLRRFQLQGDGAGGVARHGRALRRCYGMTRSVARGELY
jgi:hypothetical protein